MADYSPPNSNGQMPFTSQASAAITGGQLVTASGDNTCAPSTTGDHPIGVAAGDAAVGAKVSVWPITQVRHESRPQGVVAIAAGAPIVAGTTGFVNVGGTLGAAAAAGTLIGICTKGGTGGTSLCQWVGTG
jgi:hypothetical protein